MRIGNLSDRLVVITDAGASDVEKASAGQFDADPQAIFERWPEFRDWAAGTTMDSAVPFDPNELGPPAPRPAQVFAIGANYREHAAEGGMAPPEWPMVFAKYVSSFAGPFGAIELPTAQVDWEVELVVVIGQRSRNVAADEAWNHVAGLTVGQDLSEREIQLRGHYPQMSIGKSLPGFSPTGPFLVTPDAFDNPDDLSISCSIGGETMQEARTGELIFSVPSLIRDLSALLPLLPGDVVFTGTPSGVGLTRQPPRFLRPGDELVSRIEGIGEMRHTFHGSGAD